MHNTTKESLLAAITHGFGYRKTEKAANQMALELLDFFQLADLADSMAGGLPYGAQRRLEIVRALASSPHIILLDEPAAGMNPSETAELMENIRRIRDTSVSYTHLSTGYKGGGKRCRRHILCS